MNEKQTQNPLDKEYKYIMIFPIEDNTIDFKQLRKKLKKIPEYQNILFVLKKEESNRINFYSYDYFQLRKKSIGQLKLVEASDLNEVLKLTIQTQALPLELLKSVLDNNATITKIDNDTVKKFASTYGYPHTYLSRMYECGMLGTGIGASYGLIAAGVGGYFAYAAIALLAASIASPIGLAIIGIILFSLIAVGCFVASTLLIRVVGGLIGALYHYQEKPSAELKLQNQPADKDISPLTDTKQLELPAANNSYFSAPLTLPNLSANNNDADEDTFTREEFRKAIFKL